MSKLSLIWLAFKCLFPTLYLLVVSALIVSLMYKVTPQLHPIIWVMNVMTGLLCIYGIILAAHYGVMIFNHKLKRELKCRGKGYFEV